MVWLGDTNYHVAGCTAQHALSLIAAGRQLELLEAHDELLEDKEGEQAFVGYHEPVMAPSFYPSYKKKVGRGPTDYSDPSWPLSVYNYKFKEMFYKGGRTVDRIPSWTDRIQYHSLPDKAGQLLPEPLDPARPEGGAHNYSSVNDGAGCADISDHSPVYATFTLAVAADAGEVDEGLAAEVERMQQAMGYQNPAPDAEEGEGGGDVGSSTPGGGHLASPAATASRGLQAGSSSTGTPSSRALLALGATAGSTGGSGGLVHAADFSALHPSLRPLEVVLSLRSIQVEHRGQMRSPRAVSVLFPLPYEDSNDIPDRQKVARSGTLFSFGSAASSESREGMHVSIPVVVSRAAVLGGLHLLIKVSMDDGTKAQCVVAMRDGGFVGAGTHINTFLQPLSANGLPLRDHHTGRPVSVQFELGMNAYERGGLLGAGGGPGAAGHLHHHHGSPYGHPLSAAGGGAAGAGHHFTHHPSALPGPALGAASARGGGGGTPLRGAARGGGGGAASYGSALGFHAGQGGGYAYEGSGEAGEGTHSPRGGASGSGHRMPSRGAGGAAPAASVAGGGLGSRQAAQQHAAAAAALARGRAAAAAAAAAAGRSRDGGASSASSAAEFGHGSGYAYPSGAEPSLSSSSAGAAAFAPQRSRGGARGGGVGGGVHAPAAGGGGAFYEGEGGSGGGIGDRSSMHYLTSPLHAGSGGGGRPGSGATHPASSPAAAHGALSAADGKARAAALLAARSAAAAAAGGGGSPVTRAVALLPESGFEGGGGGFAQQHLRRGSGAAAADLRRAAAAGGSRYDEEYAAAAAPAGLPRSALLGLSLGLSESASTSGTIRLQQQPQGQGQGYHGSVDHGRDGGEGDSV